MSLNWNLENIKDQENLCWEWRKPYPSEGTPKDANEDGLVERMNGVTNGLIWSTIFVGIGEITEDNVGEFAARLKVYQEVNGDLLVGKDEKTGKSGPVPITTEDVVAHIGLRCNVSYESDTQFIKKLVGQRYKDLKKNLQKKITAELKETENVPA